MKIKFVKFLRRKINIKTLPQFVTRGFRFFASHAADLLEISNFSDRDFEQLQWIKIEFLINLNCLENLINCKIVEKITQDLKFGQNFVFFSFKT